MASYYEVNVSLADSRSLRLTLRDERSECESQLNALKVSEQEESQRLSSVIKSIDTISKQLLQMRENIRNKRFEAEDKKDRADRVTRNLRRLESNLAEKKKYLEELKQKRENISARREQIREVREQYREMLSSRQTVAFGERSEASRVKKEIEKLFLEKNLLTKRVKFTKICTTG